MKPAPPKTEPPASTQLGKAVFRGSLMGRLIKTFVKSAGCALFWFGLFVEPISATDSRHFFLWTIRAGGTGDDEAYGVRVDSSGNILVAGHFSATASFGATNLMSRGDRDIFVAKFDYRGSLLWVRQAGGSELDESRDVAVDILGNVYLTGFFSGTATFGNTNLVTFGTNDIFLAKYNSAGDLLWVKQAGGINKDVGRHLAIDSAGNCCLVGWFRNVATFSSTTITNYGNNGSPDLFVAKYDPSGNLLWLRKGGGSSPDYADGVAVDSSNNVRVIGRFNDSGTFGSTTLTGSGYTIVVATYDAAGNLVWAKQAGGASDDLGVGIAVDGVNNSVVTGFYRSPATFGAIPLPSFGGYDVFVAKYDSAGNVLWARQGGGSQNDYGYGIALDSGKNNYTIGNFISTATFGNTNVVSAGEADVFVAKHDVFGNFVWVIRAGGRGVEQGLSIASDNAANLFLTGSFETNAAFGNFTLSSSGEGDVFLAKLIVPPHLTINRTGTNVALTWLTDARGFVPEYSASLSAPAWIPISTNLITTDLTNNRVNLPAISTETFFRLKGAI